MDNEPKNDYELKGLPRDIDMLATAINLLMVKPDDIRRVCHLKEVMERVKPQVDSKLIELTEKEKSPSE